MKQVMDKELEKSLLGKSDFWMTANEAKKYGLVDKVVE